MVPAIGRTVYQPFPVLDVLLGLPVNLVQLRIQVYLQTPSLRQSSHMPLQVSHNHPLNHRPEQYPSCQFCMYRHVLVV